ncbi:MAG TPA: glycoside hydrolase family 2 TIM barrel-domain containing protein [Gaiellaceae bacterium]|nr:glycoside hydrolase family 2 TIM barrel-domain containing protein [Gaiellaceae bacterium]
MTSLDGQDWQLRGCLGDEWRWHVGPDKAWDAPHWLPACVPGSVLDDLVRAGEVPSPYHERDSLLAEWVPERAWIYRRRFVADAPALRFEGVDYACTVFVDGDELASHEGLFAPFDVDVSKYADGAEHLLAVVVHAAPVSEPQVGHTSKVQVHKPRMNYGWDFCPRVVHQGIWRSVELVDGSDDPRPAAPRSVDFSGHRLTVDGEPLQIKGWNWCPLDPLYGVPRPDKLRRLLRLAKRANVNLLRVWGGGLLETPEFYEVCDELGILVWQEFSQSSSGIESVPSTDPAFVARLRDEARSIVSRLRNHHALAIWCGGNELDADDSHPAIAALREVVRELDPGRGWVATSPSGGPAGDVHGPWEHQGLRDHYALYDSATAVLYSEFGVEGMANRAGLEQLIDEPNRWPADRGNPVYEHLGAWWNNAPLVQRCFGGRIGDVETLRRASQWLQYDGLRYAVEATLRRGAGTIPWQFNESFPNAWCTAAVDWWGEPKPAYWGVARAYRDGNPSAQFATCAWGGEHAVRVTIHGDAGARFVNLDGAVVAEGRGELSAPTDELGEVFVLDLDGRNRYVMTTADTLAPLLNLPHAQLELRDGKLTNAGDVAALGVVLQGDVDDNVLDLLPGESVEVGDATGGEGWNAAV